MTLTLLAMCRYVPKSLLAFLCFIALAPVASGDGFYRNKATGWFWREEIDAEVEPEPEVQPLSAPIGLSSPSSPMVQDLAKEDPPIHSAAWFRKHLPEIRDRALDDPSLENVTTFYRSQKILLDKANRFADTSRAVVMTDPSLDESARRPLSPFGVHAAEQVAIDVTQQLIEKIAKETAILFFFLSDCRYCELEAPLLETLEKRFHYRIIPVSMDHKPLLSGRFPNFRQDEGQASHLKVQATPALFLIHPTKGVVPISQGLLSLDELVTRILVQAHEIEIISEQELASSKGLRTGAIKASGQMEAQAKRSEGGSTH